MHISEGFCFSFLAPDLLGGRKGGPYVRVHAQEARAQERFHKGHMLLSIPLLATAIADSSRHGKCSSSCCGGGGGDHFGSAFLASVQSTGTHQGAIICQKMGVSRGKLFSKNGCIVSHNSMPKLTPQLSERIPLLFPKAKLSKLLLLLASIWVAGYH